MEEVMMVMEEMQEIKSNCEILHAAAVARLSLQPVSVSFFKPPCLFV